MRQIERWGPTLIVVSLLAATAVSFVVAQRKKLEPSPIAGTDVDEIFSPVCRCPTGAARIEFTLRRPDTVTVEIVRAGNDAVVRTLVSRRRLGTSGIRLRWDGRGDRGRVVAEGTYRARVELARRRRSFLFPNPIELDATPPRISLSRPLALRLRVGGQLVVAYELSEQARPLLFVDGRRAVRGRLREGLAGELLWNGSVHGRELRPGRHRISFAAVDRAGNRSRPSRAVSVVLER